MRHALIASMHCAPGQLGLFCAKEAPLIFLAWKARGGLYAVRRSLQRVSPFDKTATSFHQYSFARGQSPNLVGIALVFGGLNT